MTRARAGSRRALLAVVVLVAVALQATQGAGASVQAPVALGSAGAFGVLGATGVANTAGSTVNGDLGVTPGGTISGFPPGTVNGTIHNGDDTATQAQSALTVAYNDAAGRVADDTLSGQDLAGMTLVPGVHRFAVAAQLTGTVTLDAGGDADAVFIVQVGTTFNSAASSAVSLVNGAQACRVFWQVGTSSTLGASTLLSGNLLAYASITVGAGSTITGRLLARTGTVTMDSDAVTVPSCAPPATTTTTAATTTTVATTTSTTTTTTTIPGVLSMTSPAASNFTPKTAPGAMTTTAGVNAFSVSDLTGSGGGWHVTAQATRFTGAYQVLAAGSLTMSAPTVAPAGPTVPPGPTVIDGGAAAVIASSAAGAGAGVFAFSATTLTLTVPAAIYAGVYSSTITLSVVTGP